MNRIPILAILAFAAPALSSCGAIWGSANPFPTYAFVGSPDPNYLGVLSVQAYGDAPGAPAGTPAARQASITWVQFLNATASTHYRLFRVAKGGAIDTTVASSCLASTTSTCLACITTGLGAQSCTDTQVAPSPQQYDYAVLDATRLNYAPVRITVAIPPSNMVLIQRDSANYEMCQLLGQTSDPLNHQRCPYSGLGAVPYNTNPGNPALGLDANYFDFGYDLFVDRWVAACNWTSQASGGMCGAGGSPGNCFGSGAPAGTIGAGGNVYYDTTGGDCYYNAAGSWVDPSAASQAQLGMMYTIDPSANGGYRPPLTFISQNGSYSACQAITDANYGAKRLLRNRESVAAMAPPWLSGEPGALNDAQISTLDSGDASGTSHTVSHYCNSDQHSGVAAGAFGTDELATDASNGVQSFNIGSTGTSACSSRFGIQDFAGNILVWLSDQITCNEVSYVCSGATSGLDSGNSDMNGFRFDGVQGPGGSSSVDTWDYTTTPYGAANFSPPLSLPLVGADGGNALVIGSSMPASRFYVNWFDLGISNGVTTRGLSSGGAWDYEGESGRWYKAWVDSPTSAGGARIGFRCALPAE